MSPSRSFDLKLFARLGRPGLLGFLLLLSAIPALGQDFCDPADEYLRVRQGAPGSIQVDMGGAWGADLPFLDRVEVDGDVIRIGLVSRATPNAGPPAGCVWSWQLKTQVDGLFLNRYEVELYHRRSVEDPQPGTLVDADPVEVRTIGCGGEFLYMDDQLFLCLQEGRFAVSARFRQSRLELLQWAGTRALTDDSGAFWFFNPDNLELMVKVLDGCDAFGHFWVFAAGLTDVVVHLRVDDTWTGQVWEHETEPGQGFDSVRDTTAFATCDATEPALF